MVSRYAFVLLLPILSVSSCERRSGGRPRLPETISQISITMNRRGDNMEATFTDEKSLSFFQQMFTLASPDGFTNETAVKILNVRGGFGTRRGGVITYVGTDGATCSLETLFSVEPFSIHFIGTNDPIGPDWYGGAVLPEAKKVSVPKEVNTKLKTLLSTSKKDAGDEM